MKKLLNIIYLLLLPFYSAFGLGQIGVSIHDTTLVVGDEIYIPVYVDSSLTGESVSSYNLQLSFNSYYFVVDSAYSDGTITNSWGALSYNTNTTGKISIAAAGNSSLSGTGVLLYLRLKAINAGTTYLSFTETTSNFFNEGTPSIISKNGRISVNAKPTINVYPNSEIITIGDTKQFSVSYGTAPYSWSVTNSSVASIDESGLLTATSKGVTKIVAQDSNGIIDSTDGVVEIRPFRFSTRDTSFYQGQTVDIPVYTTNLSGMNYSAGELTITVNQNILTPIEIITTGTMLSSYSTPSFSFNNGNFKVAFAGNNTLAGSGVLLIIRFQITSINTGGTNLTLSNMILNETDLGNGINSYFRVLQLATLNISPSSGNLLSGETLQFTASNGTEPYSWSVSNPSIATINSAGLLTAIKGGVIKVSAQDSFGGSGSSGDIYLYDTEVRIPDTTAEIAGTVDIPIYMANLSSNYSIVSLQTNVLFDSSKVKFDQIVTTGTSTDGWSFSYNNTGNKVILAGASTSGFNNLGPIIKLRFIVSPNVSIGNYSNISLEQFLFNEGSPNARIDNGKITVATSTVPNKPSNLVALLTGSTQITLFWTDNSNNESGFKVERTLDPAGTWNQITSVSQNITAFVNNNLAEGARYYYRVRAYNSIGNSDYSNEANATTTLAAPSNLTGTEGETGILNLTWTDNSSTETGFYLERKDGDGSSFIIHKILGPNLISFSDSNLTPGQYYAYRLKAFTGIVESNYSNEFEIVIVSINSEIGIPNKFELFQNYPNPFNPSTQISYQLPENSFVNLVVYNSLGQKVEELVNQEQTSGKYSVKFDASNLPSGVYIYKLQAGEFSSVKKMLLTK
ncbi:MAG: hypothetical protein COW71_02545 [Ignavibacteriales bacterium CG18_big_fil_WC_8_21_14_2_50_31_20]|nr:MAG: hypothetical protein COW71_02545 [Ignavibacteriales bacterium CG18_big_fil_WC_8_21_14_2_50_31_20]